MPASLSDFTGRDDDGVGAFLADEWPPLVRTIKALAAVFQAKFTVGTEPNDRLMGWYFGDVANGKRFRLNYDVDGFYLFRNTASEASPVWVQVFKFDDDDGAATFAGGLALGGTLTGVTGLTLAGALNMGGNNITNAGTIACTTINGISPAAHASRHNPGGADALALGGTPPAVAAAGSAGAASNFSRGDHTHQGIHQLALQGGLLGTIFGDIVMNVGTTLEVGLAGQVVTFQAGPRAKGVKSADQAVVGTGETNISSISALSLPALGVFASSRTFRVDATIQIVDTSGAAQDITVRLYNGTNGTLSDVTPKVIVVERVEASQDRTITVMHEWTPSNDAHVLWGMSIQSSGGNYTVKGAGLVQSTAYCYDVRA